MAQTVINEPVVMGNNALSIETLPSIIYQDQPVVTTRALAALYGTDQINIRKNLSYNKDRFHPGKHFFRLEGEELKGLRLGVTESNSYLIPKKGGALTLWTARGAARHAKMLDTDKAWDVFELLEENYFSRRPAVAEPTALPAGTITPVQQQELKELVQAKASAFPDGLKRRVFGQIWSRFQRKFKVPRYDELPAALFSEGRDYIISMNLNGADPLPANPTKQDKLEHNINFWANAYTRLPQREEYWEALQRRAGLAMDTFIKELEAVRADALMPFKEDRNWGVASPFDFLLDPLKAMFDHGVEDIRPIYRLFYEGIQGLKWASSILTSCSK